MQRTLAFQAIGVVQPANPCALRFTYLGFTNKKSLPKGKPFIGLHFRALPCFNIVKAQHNSTKI